MKIKINDKPLIVPIILGIFMVLICIFILKTPKAEACTNPPNPSVQSVLFGYQQDPSDPRCFFSVYSVYDIYCINGVIQYGQNRLSIGDRVCQRPDGAPPGVGSSDVCGDCMLLRDWGEWSGPGCVNQGLCAIRGTYDTVQLSSWTNTNCPCEGGGPPPPPTCPPSCTECSAVCGWGTKSCTDVNCNTQNDIACNNRACACQDPIGGMLGNTNLCSLSNESPSGDITKIIVDNGSCGSSIASCRYECTPLGAQVEHGCMPPVDGKCGSANNGMYCQKPPTASLCDNSTIPTIPTGTVNNWAWTCKGINGSPSNEPCTALKSCAYREVVPN